MASHGSGQSLDAWTLRFASPATENTFLEKRHLELVRAVRRAHCVALVILLMDGALIVMDSLSAAKYSRSARDTFVVKAHDVCVTSLCFVVSTFVVVAAWRPARLEGISPRVFELLAVVQLCLYTICPLLVTPFYVCKMHGIDPYAFFTEDGDGSKPHFSDSRILMLWSMLLAASHLLLPIRWWAMVWYELVCMLGFCTCIVLGSPEGSVNTLINALYFLCFTIVASMGKRTIERLQRSALLDFISEKTIRFETEFKLSRMETESMERSEAGEPDVKSAQSALTAPLSHYIFGMSSGTPTLEQNLLAIKFLGRQEHWLIEVGELSCNPDAVLGRGAFGVVVVGEHLGTEVALKVPLGADSQYLEALGNEIRILRRIRHPNVVAFHGVCTIPEHGVIVLCEELVAGVSLDATVRQASPEFTSKVGHNILLDICKALGYLHGLAEAVVHGDLKPGNVLLQMRGADYTAKLVDFGLSRLQVRSSKSIGGTVRWMAPEVLASSAGVGLKVSGLSSLAPATDMFSFGRIVFFVMAGKIPLADMTPADLIEKARQGITPALKWPQMDAELRVECEKLCCQCLCEEPELRATARTVQQFLLGWQSHLYTGQSDIRNLLEQNFRINVSAVENHIAQTLRASFPDYLPASVREEALLAAIQQLVIKRRTSL